MDKRLEKAKAALAARKAENDSMKPFQAAIEEAIKEAGKGSLVHFEAVNAARAAYGMSLLTKEQFNATFDCVVIGSYTV